MKQNRTLTLKVPIFQQRCNFSIVSNTLPKRKCLIYFLTQFFIESDHSTS